MILKIQRADLHSVLGKDDEPDWLWVDRISEFRDLGLVRVPARETDPDDTPYRISCTLDELRAWVEQAWGTGPRYFADEKWPEFKGADSQQSVHAGIATREDGSSILVLMTQRAFLCNDGGGTLQRLGV